VPAGHRRPQRQETTDRTVRRDTAEAAAEAVITDRIPERVAYPHKELPLRLLQGRCEICEATEDVVVHHIRKLADLGQPGPSQPAWVKLMAKRRRKTLVVCTACHHAIHTEHPTASLTT
jgi:hypothetical protein